MPTIKLLLIWLSITSFTFTTKSEEPRQLVICSQKITSGPKNHFFGYIGHVQNIPWSGDGKYILALRSGFQDRMPGPNDPADIVLIDTQQRYSVKKIDSGSFHQNEISLYDPSMVNFNDERLYLFGGEIEDKS